MVERQEIDALLISALYGELTPAEETRLAAHLDAHPADRSALADLTHARAVVRESRLLQVQVEPPQSISALLMQEAARRAPAPKADASEGFFARFFRSFMAHPAMAAAAMLVIVIGVATLVSRRKPDLAQSAEDRISESAPAAQAPQPATATAQVSGAPAPELDKNDNAAAADRGSAYRVGLADDDASPKAVDRKDTAVTKGGDARDAFEGKVGQAGPAPVIASKARPTKEAATHDGYVELRKQEPMPKDLDETAVAEPKPAAKKKAASGNAEVSGFDQNTDSTVTTMNDGDRFRDAPGASASGGGGAASGTSFSPPPPPPAPRLAAPVTTSPRAETESSKAPDPTTAWAQTQHKTIIAQVNAGRCEDAARTALELSNRAPAYYEQNVANDRSVKNCMSYITAEREKAEEQRAQKNRASATKRAADEPARAKAATTKPAADSPSK